MCSDQEDKLDESDDENTSAAHGLIEPTSSMPAAPVARFDQIDEQFLYFIQTLTKCVRKMYAGQMQVLSQEEEMFPTCKIAKCDFA